MTKPVETKTFANYVLYSCVDSNDETRVFQTLMLGLKMVANTVNDFGIVELTQPDHTSVDIRVTGVREKFDFEYVFELRPERISDIPRDTVTVDMFTIPIDVENVSQMLPEMIQVIKSGIASAIAGEIMNTTIERYSEIELLETGDN